MMNDCVKVRTRSLGMLRLSLGDSSMRLWVPFIAPRQLGACWRPTRKAILAFCRVAHRTVRCTTRQSLLLSGARSPSFSGEVNRCSAEPVGTPDSLVPPADRWRGPRVARGLRDRPFRWRPLAHRTVRCTTGQSGEL
jgi:hypothetical protein